jgi:hypothetical protein
MAKFTRGKALEKLASFRELSTNFSFMPKVAINIVNNKKQLEEEEKLMQVAEEQGAKLMKAYQLERVAICSDAALKDAEGKPRNDGKKFLFPTPEIEAATEAKVAELAIKHAEAFRQTEEFNKQIPILLEEEVEYTLLPVSLKDCKEPIRPEILEAILDEIEV